jgi:TatD DNase family protein
MIETHCHLDYLKAYSLDEILRLSRQAGVEKIITIAVEPDNLQTVLELALQYPEVWCSQGVHPHDSRLMTDEILEQIKQTALSSPKVVAIGEIGLDFHYNNSPKNIQIDWFIKQLELASAIDKPVIIHSRDADQEMMDILRMWASKLKRKGVLHSFSSGLELAQTAIDLGFYLGFNGMITFAKAENVRDALKLCPMDRLLIETDSPFLTPVPHRGKENGPYFLPLVLEKMAELKAVSVTEMKVQLESNGQALFLF